MKCVRISNRSIAKRVHIKVREYEVCSTHQAISSVGQKLPRVAKQRSKSDMLRSASSRGKLQ